MAPELFNLASGWVSFCESTSDSGLTRSMTDLTKGRTPALATTRVRA